MLPGPLLNVRIMPLSYKAPVSRHGSAFKDGIFEGKVLFCTGGGSGICKKMTESIVRDILYVVTLT